MCDKIEDMKSNATPKHKNGFMPKNENGLKIFIQTCF